MAIGKHAFVSRIWRRVAAAVLLLVAAHGARAASVFKCVDAHGAIAFQATPCNEGARQASVEIHEQPLIDPDAPVRAPDSLAGASNRHGQASKSRERGGRNTRTASNHGRKQKPEVSYECRASDGEVFYRHAKCPASVPGDGIARFGVEQPSTASHRGRSRSRGGAWSAVRVTARKVSREEACRAINAVAADGRDGHARDEQVSVYDHDLGRDPCGGY
ncbi:MAG: DUF4124 domain-containing protein [Proteobacteria bacterium]|nr:DUF4124 domain-containing protein [Pseudomonadota bacterium]